MIDALIDKVDNSEAIRDQIANILATESVSQQALAVIAGEDPLEWKLRVFTERANPWEQFLNTPKADRSPIVNVWVDSSAPDLGGSTVMDKQKVDTTYNIDCYGYAVASEDGTGHKPGDREAAFEVQRAVRLVRNILMADIYTYLDLRGVVGGRMPGSITYFQPDLDNAQVQQMVAARLALRVNHIETSPQQGEETLEYLAVDIKRDSDGMLIAEADYDYTL